MDRTTLAVIVASFAAPAALGGEVVFSNFTTGGHPSQSNGYFYNVDPLTETDSFIEVAGPATENESRSGDIVTLGGSARLIDLFQIRLRAESSFGTGDAGSAEMTLDLYTVQGGLPDQLLWSGSRTIDSLPVSDAIFDVSYSPNVAVPDTFAWAVSFHNVRGRTNPLVFGLSTTGVQPSIGSSPIDIIEQTTATGAWTVITDPTRSFDGLVHITAVPGPGVAALAPAMLLSAARRRRA